MPLEGKEDVLFELEVLLKASACFANPRNHPGLLRRAPIVAQDFREATQLTREGVQRAVDLTRMLLGTRDRTYVFYRYLETVLPEDAARTRLGREGTSQSSPEESLLVLRHGLSSLGEVIEGVLRAQHTPFRLFYASLSAVRREVERNAFFNPLTALEFRPEFDLIKPTAVVDLMRNVPAGPARRLVALAFLSLFRMLRYLRLLARIAAEPHPRRRRVAGRTYLVLSVLRSDARALSEYLRRHASEMLAVSFERDLFAIKAGSIREHADALRARGHRLLGIKSALEAITGNLRLEMRRAFQHDLPPVDAAVSEHELRAAISASVSTLRPALRNAILFLGKALGSDLEAGGVFDDQTAHRESSERLRRDVWMFAQIVRAFSAKARNTPAADLWSDKHGLAYVREFLAYFRSMGYPLLRSTDYPGFDAFTTAIERLSDTDIVDPARLTHALEECGAFHEFLTSLVEEIGKREVLANVPFDRRAAAATLKLYLGASYGADANV
jgi:hypothetical protein